MKEGIKQLIKTFHQRGLPEIKNRDLDHINLKTDKIISLIGSRRVGKTYSCFQLIKKIMKEKKLPIEYFLYINFEDERVDFKAENLQYITDIYQEMYPKLDISKCFFFF